MGNGTLTISYPLSPMQEGMLFQNLYDPQTGVDIEQLVCAFSGINTPALERAWRQVWRANAVLRSSFEWFGLEEPVQHIHHDLDLPWQELDWRNLPDDSQERFRKFLREDRLAGFNLNQPPLMRFTLIQRRDGDFWLVWTYHHILLDGRSLPILIKQMAEAYQACLQDQPIDFPPLRPYRDYIDWLGARDWREAKEYWATQLLDAQNPATLKALRFRSAARADGETYGTLESHLSAELTDALRGIANKYSLTVNTMLQGAWAVLLSRYSGETDVTFGIIRTGRRSAFDGQGAAEMVGTLINTLPARVQINPASPVLQTLKDLRARALELRDSLREHFSLAEIQKMSGLQPGSRLFDSILAFEKFDINESLKAQHPLLADWRFDLLEYVGYPLVLSAYAGSQLKLALEYDSASFDADTMRRLMNHYQVLLNGIAADPLTPVCRLPILTEAEQRQFLGEWNNTRREYPRKCIHELFEEQARRSPDRIAVVFENQRITYRDLNRKVNRLAWHLRGLGVNTGTMVGILAERSAEMIVGVLGILKAGGAYVPLDPAHPQGRLAFILRDTRAPLVLTQYSLTALLPQGDFQVVRLDADALPAQDEDLPGGTQPSDLAYAVYTSGSTGQPKGVAVTHANLVNAYFGWEEAYELRVRPTAHLQMANYAFDVFSGDWTRALCSGGKLVICPYLTLLDAPALYALMRREEIDCAEFVPAVFRNLQNYLEQTGKTLDFMRILVVASDSWYVSECVQILKLCGNQTRLINSYGVTEATVDSTYYDCRAASIPEGVKPEEQENSLVPIGRPFANVKIYVLDAYMQLVPAGVVGELYIGGAGVARGYLNQPDLTSQRFVKDIFDSDPAARLYKTGDLARYLPDGTIEFLGRMDYQVKVRGFRVELGEIETTLALHPAVQKAVAVTRKESANVQRLAAYLTLKEGADMRRDGLIAELREFLKQRLPDYMIPAAFGVLERFPLTPSGKIDRKALPEPEAFYAIEREFTPPRTPLEKKLAEFWFEILGVENAGINDNFFDLGGHSLLATRLYVRIRDTFGLTLPLRVVFEAPTIAGLAQQIENIMWVARQPSNAEDDGLDSDEEIIL